VSAPQLDAAGARGQRCRTLMGRMCRGVRLFVRRRFRCRCRCCLAGDRGLLVRLGRFRRGGRATGGNRYRDALAMRSGRGARDGLADWGGGLVFTCHRVFGDVPRLELNAPVRPVAGNEGREWGCSLMGKLTIVPKFCCETGKFQGLSRRNGASMQDLSQYRNHGRAVLWPLVSA
jgi:hypothetical protein